jgi:hypothetical protein
MSNLKNLLKQKRELERKIKELESEKILTPTQNKLLRQKLEEIRTILGIDDGARTWAVYAKRELQNINKLIENEKNKR